MIGTGLLLGLLAVATATDLVRHRIYNWTTYPGILAALAINVLGAVLLSAGTVDREAAEAVLGWIGPVESLAGFLACGVLLLVCFVLFKVGGGDVKLMAMIGAFLGPERGVMAMLWTFVIGLCVGLIILVWRLGPRRLASGLIRQVAWLVRLARLSPLTEEERAELKPPLRLAPSALGAVVIVQFSLWERFA